MTRYPLQTYEEQITAGMLTEGVSFLGSSARTYIEVEPNYVTLHVAVSIDQDVATGRVVIPAGLIPEEFRPHAAVRAPIRHATAFVSGLWRDNGRLEIEGRPLPDGNWLNGAIRGKRVDT